MEWVLKASHVIRSACDSLVRLSLAKGDLAVDSALHPEGS